MKVVFWEPEVIQHLSNTWEAFQSKTNDPLLVIDGRQLLDIRKKQGWKTEKIDNLKHVMLNQEDWWRHGKSILEKNPKAIHAFVGFWTVRKYFPLILYAVSRNFKVAVLDEPYSVSFTGYLREEPFIISWFKVKLRPFIYRFFALSIKLMSRGTSPCILSISLLARDQFIKAGFCEKTIFPFGYFVNKLQHNNHLEEEYQEELKLVFVGGMLKRKGLDILIESVESLNRNGVHVTLDIFGAGQPEAYILGDSVSIRYKGILSQDDVQRTIINYDFLVLPSRNDGWGVVVNEALLQGVPVVVSDHVGAKCIVENTGSGVVFKSEEVNDLIDLLRKLALTPNLVRDLKEHAKNVGQLILPEVAASYLFDVFNYYFQGGLDKKPDAIWCDNVMRNKSNENSYISYQLK